MGSSFQKHITNFIRGHIETHLDNELFYKSNIVRDFDQHTNTPVEGIFNGLKNHTNSVKPNMKLSITSTNSF